MYVPSHFKEEQTAALHAMMQSTGLATIVSMSSRGLYASHAPLLLDSAAGPHGRLIGHLARSNPHWRLVDSAVETLVIFQGADGYISPSYYATKRETGKVVPTWNYSAVHAYGVLEIIDDAEAVHDIVDRLTQRYEAPRAAPWAVSDAPKSFVQDMLRGIVGIALTITRLEGKVKMSQNRPPADQAGVIDGLRADGAPALAGAVAHATGSTD
jgi:transcriptional regulator